MSETFDKLEDLDSDLLTSNGNRRPRPALGSVGKFGSRADVAHCARYRLSDTGECFRAAVRDRLRYVWLAKLPAPLQNVEAVR